MSRRTQTVEIHRANEQSGLAFFSADLGLFSGNNIGNDSGVILREKEPRMPVFASDNVGIDYLMIYTDLIKYNIDDDAKAPLLRYFVFFSKFLSGVKITTGWNVNYQTLLKLHLVQLLKNLIHSIHIDLRDTSGEKLPFVSDGSTRVLLMFIKASIIHF